MKDIVAQNEDYKVILSYIGEGYNGDYESDDAEDVPLLRCYIYSQDNLDETIRNGSSCLQIDARIKRKFLQKAANALLEVVTSKSKEDGENFNCENVYDLPFIGQDIDGSFYTYTDGDIKPGDFAYSPLNGCVIPVDDEDNVEFYNENCYKMTPV